MDAFETLIASILRADGYWVQSGVRVKLSAEDKRALNNYSTPNPEVDIVAYRPASNALLVIECKSYFDSGGIHARDLKGGKNAQRYKMFVNAGLRDMVLERLAEQLAASGLVIGDAKPRLGLAYGHASAGNQAQIEELFQQNGWLLLGPDRIRERVLAMADEPYDSQVASVVAKLFKPMLAASLSERLPIFAEAPHKAEAAWS